MDNVTSRFGREDLRKRLADVLKKADDGAIVTIGSRWGKDPSLHIMNDQQLKTLKDAEEKLRSLAYNEGESAAGRLRERLREALELLGRACKTRFDVGYSSGRDSLVTPEVVARTLHMQDPSSFEDILAGRRRASFRLLRRFAWTYGFNPVWIETGVGPKFAQYGGCADSANIIENAKRHLSHRHFHFILFEKAEQWPVRLLIGDGAYSWQSASGNWYLDHHALGGSGRNAQVRLFALLKKLREECGIVNVTSSRVSGEESYATFYREREHPAWFYGNSNPQLDWADDLMDLAEGKVKFEDFPEGRYGSEFKATGEFMAQNLGRIEKWQEVADSFKPKPVPTHSPLLEHNA